MGAVVSILSISEGVIPANKGCLIYDPILKLEPQKEPVEKNTAVVLSNAFGFGGNNASLVVSNLRRPTGARIELQSFKLGVFNIHGCACLTGAGDLRETLECIYQGNDFRGIVPSHTIMSNISQDAVRRQKRLSRMVLSLAIAANGTAAIRQSPSSVFFGTAWGSLSETYDFLRKLFESDERFASPTDFIGSVHNAAAGQVAMHFKSTGPNVTVTGGDYSFEQALFSAGLLMRDCSDIFFLIGADEYHEKLSPLIDASVAQAVRPSDGGAALVLSPATCNVGPRIASAFFSYAGSRENIIEIMVQQLGGFERISEAFGAIFVGIPAAFKDEGKKQLDSFLAESRYAGPIIEYRNFIGEFASASAVATVLAVKFVHAGELPSKFCNDYNVPFKGKAILMLGFGNFVTAVEILPL
jgi:3-oxoacyl-[acyl-carrier-protein] synthase-1/3-oxoacyl-[acyl-carrier-protein] synthase II